MEIIIVLVLIAINGFFALSEIAFVSSRREIIEGERESGSENAAMVIRMMDTPDRFLSSIQVGITMVGVISGVYGGVAIAAHITGLFIWLGMGVRLAHDVSLVFVVGIITYLSIVLGELVPKTLALRDPEKVILAVIPVITVFSGITFPVVSFLSWSTKAFLKCIGQQTSRLNSSEDPLQEILGIAKAAALRNKISREQEGIIIRAARLKTTKLSQIMVKRSEMRCLTVSTPLPDALIFAHIHQHTRFPLIDESNNNILGYVNFKDIVNTLRINPVNPSLKGIYRPIIYFYDNQSINFALRRLITSHQHIAIIQDNDNNVVGMLTLENILETIVGDIKDEYDIIPDHLFEIFPGRYMAGGGVVLKDLYEAIMTDVIEDTRTIDQLLREHLGMELKAEMQLEHIGLKFTIRKVSRSHVYEVIIEKKTVTE
jgi:putative hemolysin